MLKDKKVLCVIGARSVGGAEGGIENQIFLLLPYLSKRYKVIVFVDKRFERISEKKIKSVGITNVKIIGISAPPNRPINKILLSIISAIISLKYKPDIVYFNGLGCCLPIPLIKLSKKTKVVVHIRSYDILYPDWNIIGKIMFAFIIMLVRCFADKIISTNPLFQRLISKGTNKKAYLLENAAILEDKKNHDDSSLLRSFQHKYGIALKKCKYVLFIGRITPFKRIELLIKAYLKSSIKSSHKLLIVGGIIDKKYYCKLKRMIPEEYQQKILFLGKMDKRFIPLLYKNAHCVVLPSYFEGMPNVVIEACVYGTPIYVSDISPHLSLKFLKRNAYFSNEKELAIKLEKPKRTCMRGYVLSCLHPKKIASDLIKIFEEK